MISVFDIHTHTHTPHHTTHTYLVWMLWIVWVQTDILHKDEYLLLSAKGSAIKIFCLKFSNEPLVYFKVTVNLVFNSTHNCEISLSFSA